MHSPGPNLFTDEDAATRGTGLRPEPVHTQLMEARTNPRRGIPYLCR